MESNLTVKQLTTGKDVKAVQRDELLCTREERKAQILLRKRFKPHTSELIGEIDDRDLTTAYVRELTEKILKYSSETETYVQLLRRTLTLRPDLISSFFEVENSVRALVSHLTGRNSELHLESSWCISILAGTEHARMLTLVRQAAPYLITYLGGSNTVLQEHCLFAIGNMAGDSQKARDMLRSQGAIFPLVKLFKSSDPGVLSAAAFAATNFAQDSEKETMELVEGGLAADLHAILNHKSKNQEVLKEVAWLLSYLTYEKTVCEQLVVHGIIEDLVNLFPDTLKYGDSNFPVYTPIIRSLGNISSHEESWCIQIANTEKMIRSIFECCQSKRPHVKKESTWLLSNLLCCNTVLVNINECNIDVYTCLYNLMTWSTPVSCKKQVIRCLCNIVMSQLLLDTETSDQMLLQRVLETMAYSDHNLILKCLQFVELFIKVSENGLDTLLNLDGISYIEPLQYHSVEGIRSLSNEILRFASKDS